MILDKAVQSALEQAQAELEAIAEGTYPERIYVIDGRELTDPGHRRAAEAGHARHVAEEAAKVIELVLRPRIKRTWREAQPGHVCTHEGCYLEGCAEEEVA